MNAGEFASIVGAALAVLVAITGFVRSLWRKRTRVRVTVAIGWITLGAERTPAIDILVRNNSAAILPTDRRRRHRVRGAPCLLRDRTDFRSVTPKPPKLK